MGTMIRMLVVVGASHRASADRTVMELVGVTLGS